IMGKVIAITNQQRGVGTTTSTVNLGASLASLGNKVLFIDIDLQGNATSGVGVSKGDIYQCVYNLLDDDRGAQHVPVRTVVDDIIIIPVSIQLAGDEIDLVSTISREVNVKKSVDEIKDKYDYILIDCPPSLGLLTTNALTA